MPGAFVGANAWQFLITDLGGSVLADVTEHVLDPVIGPRISNPHIQTWTVALTPEVLSLGSALFANGLRRGVAIRNGTAVANDKLWNIKPAAGPTSGYVTLEFVGVMRRWERRYCQDVNAQIFDGPSADGTDRGLDLPAGIVGDPDLVVAAGEMLRQALENTIANDGDLEVTLGGPFSSTPTPGGNVAFAMRNLSPLRISELVTLFRDAGACDVIVTPNGAGSSSAGSVSAVNKAGVPRPSVVFEYGTGANNVSWCYPESSCDELANKLWFELGQRAGSHFKNNVTADAPGVTTDDSASRGAYGVYHDIVLHPVWSGAIRNSSNLYKMFVRRYNAELAARMVPRTLVHIVPQAGIAPEPWDDFGLGDQPVMNLANAGIDVSGASFRVVGWNARPQRNGNDEHELLIGWAPEA